MTRCKCCLVLQLLIILAGVGLERAAAKSETLKPLYDQVFCDKLMEPKRVLVILSQLNDELSKGDDAGFDLTAEDKVHVKTLVSACTIRDHHCNSDTFKEYERLRQAESNENAKRYLTHCEKVQFSFCVRFLTSKVKHEAQDIRVRERSDMSDLLKIIYKLQPVDDQHNPQIKGSNLVMALVKYLKSKKSSVGPAMSEKKFEAILEEKLLGMCANFEFTLGPVVDELISITHNRNELNLDDQSQNWINSVKICRRFGDRSNEILDDVYQILKDKSGLVNLVRGCFKGSCFNKRYAGD